LAERQQSLERALEDAVSRAVRDNLAPLQRTADELQEACADLVAACSSSRPSNALPAMLRAQAAASSLAAGLSVLSNFVAVALHPRDGHLSCESAAEAGKEGAAAADSAAVEVAEPAAAAGGRSAPEIGFEWVEEGSVVSGEVSLMRERPAEGVDVAEPGAPAQIPAEEPGVAEAPAFDLSSLPSETQDLHRRANRVAKVAMQDIKLLRPQDVRLGREHKDICYRLRSDLDKARKEYDRRFGAILEHPVDYFHRWMVEILAEGDVAALGEYPYPSPVVRR
jgi:hypothetical protein